MEPARRFAFPSGTFQQRRAAVRRDRTGQERLSQDRIQRPLSSSRQTSPLLLQTVCSGYDSEFESRSHEARSGKRHEGPHFGPSGMDGTLRPLKRSEVNSPPKITGVLKTLSSPGRPGSPPPELLTQENIRSLIPCLWHFRAMPAPESAICRKSLKAYGFLRCALPSKPKFASEVPRKSADEFPRLGDSSGLGYVLLRRFRNLPQYPRESAHRTLRR